MIFRISILFFFLSCSINAEKKNMFSAPSCEKSGTGVANPNAASYLINKKGLNVKGKCSKCGEIVISCLGCDAKVYDKTKYAKSDHFVIGRIRWKFDCAINGCMGKLDAKSFIGFRMADCLWAVEGTKANGDDFDEFKDYRKAKDPWTYLEGDNIDWSSLDFYIKTIN